MAETNGTKQLQTAIKESVREFAPSAMIFGVQGDAYGFYYARDLLPAWWLDECDRQLRALFYNVHNTLAQGAINLFIQNVLSTPYEIQGGRNLTFKWQDIFFDADFGEGYDYTMSKFLLDFLTLNRGGFLGISAYGDPDTPLKEDAKITGVYHLDALRIVTTGNWEYPYLYYSEWTGQLHRLHRTRVIRMVDLPSGDTSKYGIGTSAFYRMVSVANAEMLLSKYTNEMLSDMPPSGIAVMSNIKPEHQGLIRTMYEADRTRDGANTYRGPMQLASHDPSQPAKVEFVKFSQVPEGFDWETFVRNHVNMIALALAVDPQDIWPLTGAAMGTGTQSRILARKVSGKGYGYMLKRLERIFNRLIPRSLEFQFTTKNEEQDREAAETAKVWVDMVSAATVLTDMEKRQMLANNVESFADVLLDEAGNVRVPDDDPKTEEDVLVEAGEIPPVDETADDAMEGGQAAADQSATDDIELGKAFTKAIQATVIDFEDAVTDAITAAKAGTITRTRFGTLMRAHLRNYGTKAYKDGLEDGGVDVGDEGLDSEDLSTIAVWLTDQSPYVTSFSKTIYDGVNVNPESHAQMWANKSLMAIYDDGRENANRNMMLEFAGKDGVDSCNTCQRLEGQRHRLKDWKQRRMRPRVDTDNFDCGGWRCQHTLIRTTERARGRW